MGFALGTTGLLYISLLAQWKSEVVITYPTYYLFEHVLHKVQKCMHM